MGRLPKFSTLEEEAEFWEHHSLTEYMDELEDVEFEVEVSPEDTMLTFRVSPHKTVAGDRPGPGLFLAGATAGVGGDCGTQRRMI